MGSGASRCISRSAGIALLIGGLLGVSPALTAPLPTGALTFRDVNFTHPGASSATTGVGLAAIDYSAFISFGYVNVAIGGVWVIQNMPVDPAAYAMGVPGLSEYVNLPAGSSVAVLGDISAVPSAEFPNDSAGAATITKSTAIEVNAQGFDAGFGSPVRAAAPAAQGAPLGFASTLASIYLGFQPGHTKNIEQDINQCAPASVANSLDYLETRYGLPVKEDHKSGVAGAPADSIVAKLDTAMGRPQGTTVGWLPILQGKLDYVDGLRLVTKHQVSTQDAPNEVERDVSGTKGGGKSLYKGEISTDFILAELARGEDLEMGIFWDVGGGHFVELIGGGTIFGLPWIAFQHDAKQGYDAATGKVLENGGIGLLDGGYGWSFLVDTDGDGRLNFRNFFDGARGEVAFVISQSVPEPPAIILLLVAALSALAVLNRRARSNALGGRNPRQEHLRKAPC